jgi:BolA protein
MPVRDEIIKVLEQELSPVFIDVSDFSEKHRGHAGYGEKGESHFAVIVVSDGFTDKTRIERQRMVYGALNDMVTNGPIHALTIKALTIDEAKKSKILMEF